MQYGQFEKILIQTFTINERDLGAFRARLRHLRSLGIPNIPKRGSGNTAIYRMEDLLAASVALALQALGSTPKISAEIAKFAAQNFEKLKSRHDDIFLVVTITTAPNTESSGKTVKSPPSIESGFFTNNSPLRGNTFAFIIIGAAQAGGFATNAKVVASSVINLSQRVKALTNEV
jgi:hypothetical protein